MSNKWRRFELMLPRQFNDGSSVSEEAIADVVSEDHRQYAGAFCRDEMIHLVVDIPDTVKNRRWMKEFKARWMARLKQLELWMVSYRIEVE